MSKTHLKTAEDISKQHSNLVFMVAWIGLIPALMFITDLDGRICGVIAFFIGACLYGLLFWHDKIIINASNEEWRDYDRKRNLIKSIIDE